MANKFLIIAIFAVSLCFVRGEESPNTNTQIDENDPEGKFSFSDFGSKLTEGGQALLEGGKFVGEKLLNGAQRAAPVAAGYADVVLGTNNAGIVRNLANLRKPNNKKDGTDEAEKN